MQMDNSTAYLDYWQKRQAAQKKSNQKLAKAARETVKAIAQLLIAQYPIQKIILFGSLVKGNFHPESDIDLAVAGIPASVYFEALAKVNRMALGVLVVISKTYWL
jgi:predicted nucleotidyltransferase